jgi:hypothetical protein
MCVYMLMIIFLESSLSLCMHACNSCATFFHVTWVFASLDVQLVHLVVLLARAHLVLSASSSSSSWLSINNHEIPLNNRACMCIYSCSRLSTKSGCKMDFEGTDEFSTRAIMNAAHAPRHGRVSSVRPLCCGGVQFRGKALTQIEK